MGCGADSLRRRPQSWLASPYLSRHGTLGLLRPFPLSESRCSLGRAGYDDRATALRSILAPLRIRANCPVPSMGGFRLRLCGAPPSSPRLESPWAPPGALEPLLGQQALTQVQGWALGLPLSTTRGGFSPPGTSLLQEVVYLVSQGADPDEIGLMNIDEQLPVLEYPQPGLDIIKVPRASGTCPITALGYFCSYPLMSDICF
ncbi:hypothetical protein P7K49_002359 [Saguinus oedipus]|uniref:Uncharacterized protein n=1 Tax=Saguinus oedipus TaxID=9490 RepID=A0ABQ9WH33_SAGOE|nr:hypothetical protein P7K49_002359 [Saguinus oedipus]